MAAPAPGRNDPCPCGSGRKYKQCCADRDRAAAGERGRVAAELRRGRTLERQGRVAEAITAYRFIAESSPEAQSRLGNLFLAQGWPAEAIVAFRAAAAADDSTPRRMDGVRALVTEGRHDDAEAALRRIVADDPRCGDAWWMLGNVLTEGGAFDEAAAALERSLAIHPHQGGAWYDLVRCRRLVEADRPMIARMRAAGRGLTVGTDIAKLHLALGKAHDDLGEPDMAVRHFAEANHIKALLAKFDRAGVSARTDALIARFTREFFAAGASGGHPSRAPVMIVGLPRSGTTLLEQILSSHPAVAGAGELSFWLERDGLAQSGAAPAAIADLQSRTARAALDRLAAVAPGAERVIDKNPFNFLRAGLIHLVFPQAVILHCRRQAIDTCLSISSTWFDPRSDFPASPTDLVFYHREYVRLTDHWRDVLPPDRFIDVDYEALVSDPEATARPLLAALGLAWDDACLWPERNTRTVRSSSRWQVRQPIHRGAVDRWRRYEPWLGDLAVLVPGR
jgi:tetratricopeptide (TPR) repeat protein